MLQPIYNDYKKQREQRQKENNQVVFDLIKKKNYDFLEKYINIKELDRVLIEIEKSKQELLEECSLNDTMNKLLSGRISKKSSRQGSKDEITQISICHQISSRLGIHLENIDQKGFRMTKNGEILSKEQIKNRNIGLDQCLKSFDGKIKGKIEGWIFAKIVYGSGGHQDNVFEEADHLCECVSTFHPNSQEIFVVLIDTDLLTKVDILKTKYQHISNIFIGNHFEFQKYLINHHDSEKDNI